jgi:hypothetical protein
MNSPSSMPLEFVLLNLIGHPDVDTVTKGGSNRLASDA